MGWSLKDGEEEMEQGEDEEIASMVMWLSRLRLRHLNSIISLPCSKLLPVITDSKLPHT